MSYQLVDFTKHSVDFTWDYRLHFPVPTTTYILNRLGINVADRHATIDEAKGQVLAITRTARNYAYRFKDTNDRRGTEFQLAHNVDAIYDVLEYIMEFVSIFYTSGSYLDLLNVGNKVIIPAIDNALGQTILVYNSSAFAYNNKDGDY